MVELTRDPLDPTKLLKHVTRPECGAEVLFVGTTRQWTAGIETEALDYDGYEEMAVLEMERLIAAASDRWTITAVAISHRLGRVNIGEPSVAVAVGAPHRGPAFAAAEWIIDELKRSVPIWKKDIAPDSQSHWVHPS